MKLVSGRVTFSICTFLTLGFLIASSAPRLLAHAGQQRPDKPKLQKPQQPRDEGPQQKDDAPIRIGTDLVVLDVSVVDPSNKPAMDLKQEDFIVTEDKVPQKIDHFSRDQVPVSLVFAIDTSGSMRPKLDTVVKASGNLVKESRSGDEMAVIEFKDQPELLEEFTR